MNFDFIPYQLNADISDFEDDIQYISSDNGVDLYKAREGLIKYLLGFSVTVVNLYFFEGNLITVYIHLGENPENIEQVSKTLEHTITRPGKALKLDFGSGYCWNGQNELLALINSQRNTRLMLYFTLSQFSII